jgi:hypothetical protein
MNIVNQVTQAMQSVLTHAADQAARDSGFRQRRSKLGGAAFARMVVFGSLSQPRPTLEDYAQTAAALGVTVQPQAIDQRFTPQAADYLRRVLAATMQQVIAADPVVIPLLQQFPGVFLEDSTTVPLPDALRDSWPGCGGGNADHEGTQAAIKFQVRLDYCTGQLSGPLPCVGSASDQRTALPTDQLPAGALRIADLGYFDLDVFQKLQQRGVYWLTRWQPGTALFTAAGQELSLATYLTKQSGTVVDVPVQLGKTLRLPCRLVAFRVPKPVAAKRRRRLLKKARKKCRTVSATALVLCDWNLFLTTLPAAVADAAAVSVLARLRWQIELLFKLWKSDAHLAEQSSGKPWRVLCEVLAKMIGVVVQHWLLLVGCWQYPARSVRKGAKAVRGMALALASSLDDVVALERCIAVIARCLRVAARINKRHKQPHSYQLLQQPTVYGETPSVQKKAA